MTEERLRYIAFELESPLVRLRGVEETLWQLVQGSKGEEQAAIYALLARNLERELEDIRGLWRELFALIVKPEEKPPLRAA